MTKIYPGIAFHKLIRGIMHNAFGALGLIFFALNGVLAQSNAVLNYQLELDSAVLHVTLHYIPVDADSTTFTYGEPRFGGQNDIFEGIRNIRVSAPGTVTINPSNRSIILRYPGKESVTLDYDIFDTHTFDQGTRGELFRPMIQKDYFYCHGINMFLTPDFRTKDAHAIQSVAWKKLPSFPVFYGFEPGNDGKTLSVGEMESFQMSLITGASDLQVEKFKLDKTTNYIVLRATNNSVQNAKDILNYFKKYDTTIRKFWNDDDDKSFSLILEPFLKIKHDITGMSFGNGFIGKLDGDTIVNAKRIFVISHEIGHHWIGHLVSMDSENQWFGEGFNDYITYYNLMNSQLMSPDEFEASFNDMLKLHYGSSIKNMPNDSVFANYWKLGDYSKLPYRRGCLFAFYLDHQISSLTKDKKNIRDLMLSLAQLAKRKGNDHALIVADFIEAASGILPKDEVQKAIDQYIVHGDPIQFTDDMVFPECRIKFIQDIPTLTILDKAKFAARFRIQ